MTVTTAKWTLDEYHQMIDAGILDNRQVELLRGNPVGQPFQGHTNYVYSVSFSPDGKTIASGSGDNTVRLWDLQGNPVGQPFQGHTNYVYSASFSPDGKTIASGSGDNTVRLWQVNWQDWLKLACKQLQEHSVFRDPDHSFDPEAAKAARQTCEEMVWNRMNYGSR